MQALIASLDYLDKRNDDMTIDDDVKAQEECGYHLQNMKGDELSVFLGYLKKVNRLEIADQFGLL